MSQSSDLSSPNVVESVKQAASRTFRRYGSPWVTTVEDLEQEAWLYLATHWRYVDYTDGARTFALEGHLGKHLERELQKHDKDISYEDWADQHRDD
ncbi:hypothetical protein [Puerhibacterium puerhi]|uniref:hypothetical protein n=1 Tax=Puerhibacterium puerhi TaxID=2692623 RepID=UPI00135C4A56|nr:hypothetical protein [Puerhibacterium puerhi]